MWESEIREFTPVVYVVYFKKCNKFHRILCHAVEGNIKHVSVVWRYTLLTLWFKWKLYFSIFTFASNETRAPDTTIQVEALFWAKQRENKNRITSNGLTTSIILTIILCENPTNNDNFKYERVSTFLVTDMNNFCCGGKIILLWTKILGYGNRRRQCRKEENKSKKMNVVEQIGRMFQTSWAQHCSHKYKQTTIAARYYWRYEKNVRNERSMQNYLFRLKTKYTLGIRDVFNCTVIRWKKS